MPPADQAKFAYIEDGILVFLLVLSLIGVAITGFSPEKSYEYWLVMTGVYGLAAFVMTWLHFKRGLAFSLKNRLIEQSIHWLSVALVVGALFWLLYTNELNPQSTSIVILLVLALSALLDGLRVGWRFSVLGGYLGLSSLIVVTYKDSFMWISILLALAVIGGAVLWRWWQYRMAQDVGV